jgi:hypothetical protein
VTEPEPAAGALAAAALLAAALAGAALLTAAPAGAALIAAAVEGAAAAATLVVGTGVFEVDPAGEDVALLWQAAVVSASNTTPTVAARRLVRMNVSQIARDRTSGVDAMSPARRNG